MKNHLSVIVAVAALVFACASQAVPPPNDNFTNRTALSGTDVTFNGTLIGATVESDSDFTEVFPPAYGTLATQSVWWEWSSPITTTAIIELTNLTTIVTGTSFLAVYNLEDVSTGELEGDMRIEDALPARTITFQAQAGTQYQIQFAGNNGASFTFRLIATNSPCIVQQPQAATESLEDSAMFGVVTAGNGPFYYQWQHNGTNLPGETSPILALDHLTTNEAGAYRVVITNSFGMTVSDNAHLFVTSTDTAPTLSVTDGQNESEFTFALHGEIGRRYRIESSTNLIDWTPELSFPSLLQPAAAVRSVVLNSSVVDTFTIQQSETRKYIRALVYHAVNETCVNNLKQIRYAQLLWAYEHGAAHDAALSPSNVFPYLKAGINLHCPNTEEEIFYLSYSTLEVAAEPVCQIVISHKIEEP